MMFALPERTVLGSCELRCVLGQGGGGISYLAYDKVLERPVVIKEHFPMGLCLREKGSADVLPVQEEAYADSLAAFCREARILAGLNHPNVVQVHDIFEASGTAYIIMEYAEGETLKEWLPAHGDNFPAVREVLQKLLRTLDYLHGNSVLHRDIKPTNIVVREDGEPVLLDFGSARMGTATHTLTTVGSPGYAAPEQFCPHGAPGPSADLYGLAQSFLHLLSAQQRQRYPRRFMNPMLRATLTSPEKRPQTAAEWLEAMERTPIGMKLWTVCTLLLVAGGACWLWLTPDTAAPQTLSNEEYRARVQTELERYTRQLEQLSQKARKSQMPRDEHQRRQNELKN